jgi:hypothetical protein
MGGSFGRYGEERNVYGFWWGNVKERTTLKTWDR